MIRATVYTKDEKVTGFEMLGHAGYGKYGKDIVCAAASAVVYTALGTLDEIGLRPVFQEKEGRISFLLADGIEKDMLYKAHIILQTVKVGLLQIQEGYGEYIKVKIEEV